MSVRTPGPARRIAQLDILRGIAILLVLGHHAAALPDGSIAPGWLACLCDRFGWTGVDLFFVLSGFLVGGILFAELQARGGLDVRRFLIRRGFKIWPAYYLFLTYVTWRMFRMCFSVKMMIAGLLGHLTAQPIVDGALLHRVSLLVIPNWVHLQNYLGTSRVHTWSLAVEEHFYLALPLLLVLVTRHRKGSLDAIRAVPAVAAVLMVGCAALRCLAQADAGTHGRGFTTPWQTHLRIDSLFFGVLLAYIHYFAAPLRERIARHRLLLFVAGAALVSPMTLLHKWAPFVTTLGLSLLYLGYGCILLAAVYTPSSSWVHGRVFLGVPGRVLAYIGIHSYSIYLWHAEVLRLMQPVCRPLDRVLPTSLAWGIGLVVYIALAAAAGAVASRLVEMRALRIRDRLFPPRSALAPLH